MVEIERLRVSEIFSSIDGEGPHTGGLSTFVRLHGCNLKCSYCDSRYACEGMDFRVMSVDEILKEVASFGVSHVTLTGGEPLIQPGTVPLIRRFSELGFSVCIETNGCTLIPDELFNLPGVYFCMDMKSPGSGECDKNVVANFQCLRACDCIKLVLRKTDLPWACAVLRRGLSDFGEARIYLSSVAGDCDPGDLVKILKDLSTEGLPSSFMRRCRVQIQLHKILWPNIQRGV